MAYGSMQAMAVLVAAGALTVSIARRKSHSIALTGEPSNVNEPPQKPHTEYISVRRQPWSQFQYQQEARTVDPRHPDMSSHGYQQMKDAHELGIGETVGERVMSASRKALQKVQFQMQPLTQFRQHLQGMHYDPAGVGPVIETHTYSSHLSEDCWQGLIYDSDQSNARLIGIEYMISPRLYKQLPAEERSLWHRHDIEVRENTIKAPLLPLGTSEAVLGDLSITYGKSFYFWQPDRGQTLPVGHPVHFQNDVAAVKRAGIVPPT